jgi:8-amino-7-oxononanoate synthase
MDGDLAPLGAIADLCMRAGADLVIDDAHATGLYGGARASGWSRRAASKGAPRR